MGTQRMGRRHGDGGNFATYEIFNKDIKQRLKPDSTYRFTPYEIRTVPALLRLGKKEQALELLRFMMRHRQPEKWHHMAEVAYSDKREAGYIGDMPHTWVGAEFINAVRTLFVYEHDSTLILGAGIDPQWLANGKSVTIENFPTYYGLLSYEMTQENGEIHIRLWGTAQPPNGFILRTPLDTPNQKVIVNDKQMTSQSGNEVTFEKWLYAQIPSLIFHLNISCKLQKKG